MENQRVFLFLALGLILMFMWQAWQRDYGPKPPVATVQQPAVSSTGDASGTIPNPPAADGIPSVASGGGSSTSDLPAGASDPNVPQGSNDVGLVRVRTDVLDVEISTTGGQISTVRLPTYPVSLDTPEIPFELLANTNQRLFVAQSGILSSAAAPNHHAVYRAEQSEYLLGAGEEKLVVRLGWTDESGVQVVKSYTFSRGSFTVDVKHEVINNSAESWTGRVYRQIQHGAVADTSNLGIYTYTGGVIWSDEEKYEKVDFEDMAGAPLSRDIVNGWAAVIQHYFLAAWVPETGESNHYYSKGLAGPRYILGLVSPDLTVAPGSSATHSTQFYAGPKDQDRLEAIAPGLDLTVDYGWLTFIAKPIFHLLQWIHSYLGNWGWSIIMLTVMIKLVFYKLSETSYRSMANMRRLTPKINNLKERYGTDKQRLNAAMMELYKKEKINPLGGCLPILVQIPVFIALYWVLLESVELRQAPFMFWIHDLSTKDPFYVLPLLMGVSMFIQQRLNPAPPDPIQAKIMMSLPIVFTVFFLFFPAGLVLYWVVNNVLSIAQQWVITRRIEKLGSKG